MPLQPGSDAVPKAMRRSYCRRRFLGILECVQKTMPHAIITTDIVMGFPGETDGDFEATMDVAREAHFSAVYTFQYSRCPEIPAVEM